MGKYCICYASDGCDYNRLEMSAWSARKAFGDDVDIFVLTEHYWDPPVYNVHVVNPSKPLREAGMFPYGWSRGFHFATLYRLAIPLLDEFSSYDKVLYLDTDTLVCSRDAKKKIEDTEWRDAEAYGVVDIPTWRYKNAYTIEESLDDQAKDELMRAKWFVDKPSSPCINAGVVVFDLAQIRKNSLDWYKRRLEIFWKMQLKGKFQYLDQDFINIMMDVDASIDASCNVNMVCESGETANIRHYPGKAKGLQYPDAIKIGYYRHAAAAKELSDHPVKIKAKQLIAYVCHIINEETLWRYRKLRDDVSKIGGMNVVWVYVAKKAGDPPFPSDIAYYCTTEDDILNAAKWRSPESGGLSMTFNAPNSVTMMINEKFPDYDYIWYLEYDVCYAGDWADFFRRMSTHSHDFVCEHLASRCDEPNWYWWDHSRELRPWRRSFKSLNCISRLSRRLLDTLSEFYEQTKGMPHTFFEHAWADIAVAEMSCFDLYESECAKHFNFGKIDLNRCFERGRLHHAVKDNVKWADYC